MTEYMQLQRSF